MKRVFVIQHELDDENTCLAIVAKTLPIAKSMAYHEQEVFWLDGSYSDFLSGLQVKEKKNIDTSDMEYGIIEPRKWTLLWLYYSHDGECDLCKKRPGYIYKSEKKENCLCCSKCESKL